MVDADRKIVTRRPLLSVVGDADSEEASPAYVAAFDVGRLAIDAGFRVMTGGRYGVAAAASHGAHTSGAYREGDTIGILPGADPSDANPWVDIALATGLDHLRNALVANVDVVIAIGGGAGTLSEIAFAWMYRRPIIALDMHGWSRNLADKRMDDRKRQPAVPDDRVFAAADPVDAIRLACKLVAIYPERHRGFTRS